MAERGLIGRIIVPAICIAITAAGLNNVYGDASEVERLAEQTACGKEHCAVTKLEASRNPISARYRYQTSVEKQTTATVECTREYWLIGEYRCELKLP